VTEVLSTTNLNDVVIFDWEAPADNGLSITSYTVIIINSANLFIENLDYCNGADTTIVSNTECTIPLSSLTSEPFSLGLDDEI
jgi:hypothetical protein